MPLRLAIAIHVAPRPVRTDGFGKGRLMKTRVLRVMECGSSSDTAGTFSALLPAVDDLALH